VVDLIYQGGSAPETKGQKMNTAIPTQFLNTNPNSKATFRPGGDAQYVSYMVQAS